MKSLLAIVFLSLLSVSAYAREPDSGFIFNVSGGSTPSILSIDGGTSTGGHIGYKFSPNFYLEGGEITLLNQVASGASTISISGAEIATILRFPINNRVSPYIRASFSRLLQIQTTAAATTGMEILYGPSYGVGLQFYETDHVSLRVGYNTYSLQTSSDYNVQAGVEVNTSNAYVALVFLF